MSSDNSHQLQGEVALDWVSTTITGPQGTATALVPAGFAAYARIFHSPTFVDGTETTWATAAAACGNSVEATTQWHEVVNAKDRVNFSDSTWSGFAPDAGSLTPLQWLSLTSVLRSGSSGNEDVTFALWDGWAILGDNARLELSSIRPIPFVRRGKSQRLSLPGRQYLLAAGRLNQSFDEPEVIDISNWQTPNLAWPAEHSWFLATEVDLRSTFIGGSAQLISDVVAAPGLEACEVSANSVVFGVKDQTAPCTQAQGVGRRSRKRWWSLNRSADGGGK